MYRIYCTKEYIIRTSIFFSIFVVIKLSLCTIYLLMLLILFYSILTPLQFKEVMLTGKLCDLSSFWSRLMASSVVLGSSKMIAYPPPPLDASFPLSENFCAIAQIMSRFGCDMPSAHSNPWFIWTRICIVHVKRWLKSPACKLASRSLKKKDLPIFLGKQSSGADKIDLRPSRTWHCKSHLNAPASSRCLRTPG